MLIVELRGSIITVRSEKLSLNYLDQFESLKAESDKTIANILLDGDIGSNHQDFNSHFEQRGLQYNNRGEVIVTGFEKDNYYEEGYSFFRSKLHRLENQDHSYCDVGWPGDYFLLTIEYEVGLFKQMKISADMDNFNPKSLKAVSSTLLSKPNYKMISGITYNNDRLEVGNDFGYEKKGLFAAIVRPKKSIIFNKNIYRDFIDASYAEINT
tara:strand:- start:4421 stop:5053 length:633 start_codon:yes stop_codon:yes gene_type:complete